MIQFSRLIVRSQILAYQARFEVKEAGMGTKAVCKEDSCSGELSDCPVMREEACMKKESRLLSSGGPSSSLKAV